MEKKPHPRPDQVGASPDSTQGHPGLLSGARALASATDDSLLSGSPLDVLVDLLGPEWTLEATYREFSLQAMCLDYEVGLFLHRDGSLGCFTLVEEVYETYDAALGLVDEKRAVAMRRDALSRAVSTAVIVVDDLDARRSFRQAPFG